MQSTFCHALPLKRPSCCALPPNPSVLAAAAPPGHVAPCCIWPQCASALRIPPPLPSRTTLPATSSSYLWPQCASALRISATLMVPLLSVSMLLNSSFMPAAHMPSEGEGRSSSLQDSLSSKQLLHACSALVK